MANLVTPQDQVTYLDPYKAKLFDFNNSDSRVYIARSINSLLSVQGNDIVLDGLEISGLSYNAGNNVVSMTVNPGRCILDTTMIEILEPVDLELDVTAYDDTGKLVISLSYQFLETVYANEAIMKLSYLVPNGSDTNPEPWFTQIDRLILDVFSFDKTANTITTDVDRTALAPQHHIVIKNKDYIARKKDRSTVYNEDFLRQLLN